jgi:o-succinylbenzoate---CoA ligase
VIRCLVARRPIVLIETEGLQARPRWPLAQALGESGATLTSLVPAQLDGLLSDETWRPPASLRAVLVGGAACPQSLRRRAIVRGVPVLVSYGMTETFGQVATALLSESDSTLETETDFATAIGPPLPGITIIAGTQHAPTAIEVGGPLCMTGYLGEEPLLEPKVVSSDDGWLDARGHLHVVGRRDDLIISGGYKIAPLALDEELRRTTGIVDACAFAIDDPRFGQVVAAALVVSEEFDLEHARQQWAASLPPHQRPRAVVITHRLPLGANGKVDRRAVALLQPCVVL